MSASRSGATSIWTREEDIKFETALAIYPEISLNRWEKIAAAVPGKSIEEVKRHFELLIEDVNDIDSGRVPLPCWPNSSSDGSTGVGDEGTGKKGGNLGQVNSDSIPGRPLRFGQDRRKGKPWTEEEHKLFLVGLETYGKGDWRSISRNCVLSRTPTQVASHAQKYFVRLNSASKDKRRTSIHDITSITNGDSSVPQGPITGQSQRNGSSSSSNQPPQALATPSGISMYAGTTLGQPVGGPLVPVVGTPMMNLPQPAHMTYGMRAPVPLRAVPGAPMNMGYPMPHTFAHR